MVLFLLVEGDDDKRFLDSVILPLLASTYEKLVVWRYAEQTIPIRARVIDGIVANNDEYLYVVDQDSHPCVTDTKRSVCRSLPNVDSDRILVVGRAIDSWYLAGLTTAAQRQLGIDVGRIPNLTNECDKADLESIIPPRGYKGRTEFLKELLKRYSLVEGCRRNSSLAYCCRKHLRDS